MNYVFDLDGTLAESKRPIDYNMALMLCKLIETRKVCIVSGGQWAQFESQLLEQLESYSIFVDNFKNLLLFPTSGASCYMWNGETWEQQYSHNLYDNEKEKILKSLKKICNIELSGLFGEQIEDRGAQITFSALGQLAPPDIKSKWDPDRKIRKFWKERLDLELPEFEIRIGGSTSIDITKPGIHKGFAVQEMCKLLKCTVEDLLFFGDALEPGGNDHEIYKANVWSVPVDDHIDCLAKVRLHYLLGL